MCEYSLVHNNNNNNNIKYTVYLTVVTKKNMLITFLF